MTPCLRVAVRALRDQGTVGQKTLLEELGILSIKTPHIWYHWNPLVTLRSFLMILKSMATRGSCKIPPKGHKQLFSVILLILLALGPTYLVSLESSSHPEIIFDDFEKYGH